MRCPPSKMLFQTWQQPKNHIMPRIKYIEYKYIEVWNFYYEFDQSRIQDWPAFSQPECYSKIQTHRQPKNHVLHHLKNEIYIIYFISGVSLSGLWAFGQSRDWKYDPCWTIFDAILKMRRLSNIHKNGECNFGKINVLKF